MAVIIESYTTGEDNSAGIGDVDTSTWKGQTFTIGNTGTNIDVNISGVVMRISKTGSPAADFAISIRETGPDGLPTGSDLSTGSITTSSITTSMTWISISLTNYALKKNTKYVLIGKAGANWDGSNNINWATDATSPTYGGGSRVNTSDAGVSWSETTTVDFLFQIKGGTYGGTLCTLADATAKAGLNADSTATNEALVSEYVLEAEGEINAESNNNWNGLYGALSDDVKYILTNIVSSLAAIKIIRYDMSGYTSREEAETMMDSLRDDAIRNKEILKIRQKFLENA